MRSPRFRSAPFARDGVFDHDGVSAPCIAAPHILPSALGDVLGLRDFRTFAAQYSTPRNRCVRFVAAVTGGHATLTTGRALPLTRTGLSPAGSDQLILTHPPGSRRSRATEKYRSFVEAEQGRGCRVACSCTKATRDPQLLRNGSVRNDPHIARPRQQTEYLRASRRSMGSTRSRCRERTASECRSMGSPHRSLCSHLVLDGLDYVDTPAEASRGALSRKCGMICSPKSRIV
jgi:hypothetical protein